MTRIKIVQDGIPIGFFTGSTVKEAKDKASEALRKHLKKGVIEEE